MMNSHQFASSLNAEALRLGIVTFLCDTVNFLGHRLFCPGRYCLHINNIQNPFVIETPTPKTYNSSMGIRHLHLLLCLLIMRSSTFLAEGSGEQETIYDVLRRNGLPIGLIPKVVKSYTLHDGGVFEVNLDKPCYTKFENPVYYDTLIKGNLSYGQIAGLSGVQAKELFLWFPVKVIRVDIPSTGFIYFDVGVIYKQFSLSLFENPPDCHNNASYVPRKALQ